MNFLRKLLVSGLLLLGTVIPSFALDFFTTTNISATTPFTVLSGGKQTITEILFLSSSTNTGTIRFYDTTGNATSIVRAAHNDILSYATNVTTVFTNSSGLLVTNITAGTYTYASAVAAVTNEAPVLIGPLIIAASDQLASDGLAVFPVRGFTVYSTVAGTIQLTYKKAYP